MNERRVRVPGGGRQVYGRMPGSIRQQRRSRVRRPASLGPLQRRFLVLVVVVGAVSYGLWQAFAVNQVMVTMASRQIEVKGEMEKIIAGSWRQQNLLTLSEEELESKLQQVDPLLRSVVVKRKLFHTIVVSATLKQPSLGWSSGNQNYLLDHDGVAIGLLASGASLPVVVDGSNLPVQIGSSVVSARFVSFVTMLVPALSKEGIGVRSLSVTDTTLDLNVVTDKGYRLIFDTSRGVGEEMGDLRAVRALLVTQKKVPTEYIDLRIVGKAYYK